MLWSVARSETAPIKNSQRASLQSTLQPTQQNLPRDKLPQVTSQKGAFVWAEETVPVSSRYAVCSRLSQTKLHPSTI